MKDPTQAAQSYGKTITETKPTAMFLAKMGLNLGNLNTASAQEGFSSNLQVMTSNPKSRSFKSCITNNWENCQS